MRRSDGIAENIIILRCFKAEDDISFIRILCPECFMDDISRAPSVSGHTVCIKHIVSRRLKAVERHIDHRTGSHHCFEELGKSHVPDISKVCEILKIVLEEFVSALIVLEAFLISHHRKPCQ